MNMTHGGEERETGRDIRRLLQLLEVVAVVLIFFTALVFVIIRYALQFKGSFNYTGDDYECLMAIFDRPTLWDMFSVSKVTSGTGHNTYYLPFTILCFSLIYKIFHGSTIGFQYFNIIMHFLNGVFLYFLIAKHLKIRLPAAVLSVAFVLYKPNLDMLTWLSAGMMRTIALFLTLSTLWLLGRYIQRREKICLFLSIVTCVLAFCTAQVAYFIPFVTVFYCLMFMKNRSEFGWADVGRSLKYSLPYFLVLVPLLLIYAGYKYPQGHVARTWGGVSLGAHTLVHALNLASWMLVPGEVPAAAREFLMMLFYVVSFILAGFGFLKKRAFLLFGLIWMWTGIFLATISNFRPTEEVLRYLYFPFIGFGMIIIALIDEMPLLINRGGRLLKWRRNTPR